MIADLILARLDSIDARVERIEAARRHETDLWERFEAGLNRIERNYPLIFKLHDDREILRAQKELDRKLMGEAYNIAGNVRPGNGGG